MKQILLLLLVIPQILFAGMSKNETEVPGFKLQLEEEMFLTDQNGVAIPEQIIKVPIGKLVKIYRPDGFCYKGMVTEIEEGDSYYKVYGKINNVEQTSFGFVLAKGGNFAGAILEKNNSKTYVLEFDRIRKGFVFVFSTKYDKPGA